MSNVFDAWALPSGAAAPTRASLSLESGSSQLRYLDSDPDWLSGVIDLLAHARAGLLDRRAADLCAALGSVGARLLDPHDALRKRALSRCD